ncbi:hypothetical protein LuPra_02709 [Luteitalea pratensis]|uniref:Uncharacterized protein n=1 Tax=Luteitalea pratensis TaxID=1855912 RepID=A0A143PLL9_LUTPR|nr:hypothetical protein LuPra_02709 [Luteitalea pratensis]
MHGSTPGSQLSPSADSSPTRRRRLRPAKLCHPVQDAAREARLDLPATYTAGAKSVANDGLVAEEGVLHTGLPMVARGLLSLASPERFHVGDRAIARPGARPTSRDPGRHGRRHDHPRVSRARGLIEGDRVVGRVRRDAGDLASCRSNQVDTHRPVVGRRFGEGMRDDHAGAVDTQMKLLPASCTTPAVFRGRPLPSRPLTVPCCRRSDAAVPSLGGCAPPRRASESGAKASVWSGASRRACIMVRIDRTKPSIWRRGKWKTSRSVRAVSIATSKNVAARQGDRRAARPTRPRRLARTRAVAPTDEGAFVRPPISHPIARLVRGMNPRLHPTTMPPRAGDGPAAPTADPYLTVRSHAPTPR